MNFFLRVDASQEMGSGHLMRCLTLAKALVLKGMKTFFLTRSMPAALITILHNEGHKVIFLKEHERSQCFENKYLSWLGIPQEEDAIDSLEAIGATQCDWLIADHYALDEKWESLMRSKARNIFSIDDLANRQHDCDVLLDQNLYSNAGIRYQSLVPKDAKLLLGTQFSLLRPEFLKERESIRSRDFNVRNILVFLGGADHQNITWQTLQVLKSCIRQDITVNIVLGAMLANQDEMIKRFNLQNYLFHKQTQNIATLMAQADLSIGGGGTATWERCSVGLPTIPIILAENQAQLVQDGLASGIFVPASATIETMFGSVQGLKESILYALNNPDHLEDISKKCMDLVDARGVERVIVELLKVTYRLEIRNAQIEDSDQLFLWRNHESIRAVSRTNHLINSQEHDAWIKSKLNDPNCVLLIGAFDGLDIGVVRFDLESDFDAEVSIYLNPCEELRGMGHKLLKSAEYYLFKCYPKIREIKAVVLSTNVKSEQFFIRNGYIKMDQDTLVKRITNE